MDVVSARGVLSSTCPQFIKEELSNNKLVFCDKGKVDVSLLSLEAKMFIKLMTVNIIPTDEKLVDSVNALIDYTEQFIRLYEPTLYNHKEVIEGKALLLYVALNTTHLTIKQVTLLYEELRIHMKVLRDYLIGILEAIVRSNNTIN